MKAHLLYRDRDLDTVAELRREAADITRDLGLDALFDTMAQGDDLLRSVAQRVIFTPLQTPEEVTYRQAVLRDCLSNRDIAREIYALATETIRRERRDYFGLTSNYPGTILHRSVRVLGMFFDQLKRLRRLAESHAERFQSEGFRTFFAMLLDQLSDDYLAEVRAHLSRLEFNNGVLMTAELGPANQGTNYVLRRPLAEDETWLAMLFGTGRPSHTFRIHDRDQAGARALSALNERGVNLVANATAQSNDHILDFFRLIQSELAFYVGCLNLDERLETLDAPSCLPETTAVGDSVLDVLGLYDVALALNSKRPVIGNDCRASGRSLIVITGPNQGGKSTFLRSLGQAQLMMQAGMSVAGQSFAGSICTSLHTHFKREEDASMTSGKLDEELARMSAIVDRLTLGSMVLFNESFQSTNEREGSAIAREVLLELIRHGVRVVCVTHLYDLARSLLEREDDATLFLRAERQADGTRTFRVIEGNPMPTSFGEDVYRWVFEGREDHRT